MRKKIRKSQPGYTNIVGYRIIRMKKCQFPCSPHIFRLHYSQKLTFANSLICVSYPRFSAFTTIFYKFFRPQQDFSRILQQSRICFTAHFTRVARIARYFAASTVRRLHTLPSKTHKLAPLASANFRPHHGRIGFILLIYRISG